MAYFCLSEDRCNIARGARVHTFKLIELDPYLSYGVQVNTIPSDDQGPISPAWINFNPCMVK